jgi:putative endonuclease
MQSAKRRKKSYHFGIVAEYLVAGFLILKGYRILAIRYRNPKGEIDILACKGDTLVAVEVKARQKREQGLESITPFKQRKIMQAVQWLYGGRGKIAGLARIHERNIRFDVIVVVPWRWPHHIHDAWRS